MILKVGDSESLEFLIEREYTVLECCREGVIKDVIINDVAINDIKNL